MSLPIFNSDWDLVRESYSRWIGKTYLRKLFANHFTWNGMSIWWALALAEKNNLRNESWYLRLHDLLLNNQINQLCLYKKSRLLWLLRSIIQWIVTKTISKNPIEDHEFIFHSIQYNLIKEEGKYYDRLFRKSPINGGVKISFLLKLSPSFQSFKVFKDWYLKTRYLKSIQDQPVVYLDHYLKFKDILDIFMVSFWLQIKLAFYLFAIRNKKIFFIDGKDASKILIPLLMNSFYGDLQDALLYAKSFERYLSSVAPKKKIITYGELLPGFRANYFSGHKLERGHQFVAVQHALSGKNKLSGFYKATEFCDELFSQGGRYSPMPDLYLVQGQQFSNVLGSYYPKSRVRIIGCLKYDDHMFGRSGATEVLLRDGELKSKLLVIAPSIGDFEVIKSVLSPEIDFTGWKVVLAPHPVDRVQTIKRFESIGFLQNIITVQDRIPTIELIKYADLVLTGFSVVALEALFGNALPVRAINQNLPPQIDSDEGIPIVSNPSELNEILKNFDEIRVDRGGIIAKYFYKLDGKASDRMWSAINQNLS